MLASDCTHSVPGFVFAAVKLKFCVVDTPFQECRVPNTHISIIVAPWLLGWFLVTQVKCVQSVGGLRCDMVIYLG